MASVKKFFSTRTRGFTLVEVAIVLVIVGIILSIGTASWITFMEGRRVSKTRSVLQQGKDCLVRRVVFNERYPRTEDFTACLDDAGADGWGREIKCLVGVNSSDATLSGMDFVVTDNVRNQTAVVMDDNSKVITDQGDQTRVVFVLFSLGDDGSADDASYDTTSQVASMSGITPDFSSTNDDIYFVIKSYELAAAIKNAVGH